MPQGVFVGLSTIDLVYSVNDFPASNSKVAAQDFEIFIGGPATNASITFSHLGGTSTLVTGVGRHALANLIRSDLETYSVRLIDLSPNSGDVPVIASIYVNRLGERNVVSAPSRFSAHAVEALESVLSESSVLMVDGHYPNACLAWAKAARERGVPVVLDGGSWKPGTMELLGHVDFAICSADFHPPNCLTQEDVLRFVRARGVAQVAITNGAGPLRFAAGNTHATLPVSSAEVLDTTGAGDVFHGAFCYYISTGLSFQQALEEAAGIATHSCRFWGTRDWMNHAARCR